ncbi:MAG: 2'-deoxycytidine 5'-triphosphate deaminase [Candidatus Binatia bacterium]
MSTDTAAIDISSGVLATKQVEKLFKEGAIRHNQFPPPAIDGSAFDLPLGRTAWKLTEAQRLATRELEEIRAKTSSVELQSDADEEYFLFEKGQIYLVQLDTYLDLPPNINGRATGKSSIGRLDVITRLLAKDSREYDIVEAGHNGPLYLLVLPQTFSIKVPPGKSLNQLRLFSGPPHASVITRTLIHDFGTPFWYVRQNNQKYDYESWNTLLNNYSKSRTADPMLFDLTVDLADSDYQYIYKAAPQTFDPIDLRKPSKFYNPSFYFEKTEIKEDRAAHSVLLEQGSFYIMKSKERLYIPPDVAVEVVAISERIGDIRIHYAGFAHPGFGRQATFPKRGTPLIFEVRATDMPTRLYDRSLLARIQLFRMSAETEIKDSPYDDQELKLSSAFNDWPKEGEQ